MAGHLSLFYVAVIVWFRLSGINCDFHIYYDFLYTFCIFDPYSFLSAVLLFYGGQFSGLVYRQVTVK